ncbi:MAG: homoserine O-acetyltransferase [Ignavibacteriae bacterium]|nr:homoserine O-acetyltransferase [Ignavibacteriota bacterium]
MTQIATLSRRSGAPKGTGTSPSPLPTSKFVQTKAIRLYDKTSPLKLESGATLTHVSVAYETFGTLNDEGTNAILICHALTANAHAAGYNSPEDKSPGWWDGLIGPGRAFDTDKYFVVCPNILGSCYGTTGPASINPQTGRPYRMSFPTITVRDIVRVQKRLLDVLGVNRLATVSGSSLGGMQVLEWPLLYPDFCETIIPISTAAKQSAWCLALNAAARAAITSDPDWNNGNYTQQPAHGMALARMIGMISYRSPQEFTERFGREQKHPEAGYFDPANIFQIESYLRHHGEKLAERFDANTYLVLARAMDLHDVAYGRDTLLRTLGSIRARTLSIGISTDQRYHSAEQKEIARLISGARYAEIDSIHGHDAFLIEFEKIGRVISEFLG